MGADCDIVLKVTAAFISLKHQSLKGRFMKERKIYLFILVSLLIGVVVGSAMSTLYLKPQITVLNTEITDLNSRLDSNLGQIENSLTDLKSQSERAQSQSSAMEAGLNSEISRLKTRIDSLEDAKNRLDQISSELTDVESQITGLKSQIQNEETIINVYKNVSPAVVFITSTELSYDFQLQREVPSQGVGSGVVVNSDGYILTNNHVVEGADTITVSFKPGEEIEAELIGIDPPTDLAVLKIDPPPNLPTAVLGDSDRVQVGMTAIAIGNPFALARTVTVGVVSSVNRTIDAETADIIFGIIQTDASINPGNSGGPLVNSRSEVIGINSAILSPVKGSVGIGFAIPINTAKKVMAQLIETGRVSRPYLGITGGSVADFPAELGLPEKGVLIVDVITGSPADKAGLRGSGTEVRVGSTTYPVGGDVITSLDGSGIKTIEDLLEQLQKKEVGTTVTFGVIRDGAEISVDVLLEERPQQ